MHIKSMLPLACRLRVHASIVILCLICARTTTADEVRYTTLSRKIVESRLGKYAGDYKQREIALKEMFTEFGWTSFPYLRVALVVVLDLAPIRSYFRLRGEGDTNVDYGALRGFRLDR